MKNSNTASDNISICDKYIYGFDLYLYFTYINSSNSLKSYLKDLCRVICNFKSFSVGFRRKFLNHSNIYELFLTPKKYKFFQSGFFLRIISAVSSEMFTSHSNSSPDSKFNSFTIGAGTTVIILPAFFLILVLNTIFISPYLLILYIIFSSLQYINLTILIDSYLYRNLYIHLYRRTT